MNNVLMKPVRVIHELTPSEQIGRAVERATEIRDAAKARAESEFVERIEEALERYRPKAAAAAAVPQPETAAV